MCRTLQQTGRRMEVLDGMLSSWMLCLELCHTGRDEAQVANGLDKMAGAVV